ncbi:MAG: ABC transporter permease [Acidimicrobiia bacterium]|nr:ABC transporter permease [Acidimicrobiia bacterium]
MLDFDPILVLGASLSLVGVAVVVSLVLELGFERSILWAAVRATLQLGAVGFLLAAILGTRWEMALAVVWVLAMVGIAAWVTTRRADTNRVLGAALLAIGASAGLSIAVVFGFRVLPFEPVQLIVVAGITIGNTLPATVQAADQVRVQLSEHRSRVEGLLALGMPASAASRFVVREATRVSLLPQIEKTKVVGLVALPGAMTGLLIAGVDPVDAVVIQLVVMFLVLGTVAVSTTTVALVTTRTAFTPDQRIG